MSPNLPHLALLAALGGGIALAVQSAGQPSDSAAREEAGSVLAAWAPDALVYVEVPDLERLEADLQASSLARLWQRLEPSLQGVASKVHAQGGEDGELARRALELAREGFRPRALLEAAGRHLAVELGLPEASGVELAATLQGSLSACVLGESSEHGGGGPSLSMAVAAGLRRGGSGWIAGSFLAPLERADGSAGKAQLELLRLERPSEGEVRALWRLASSGGAEQFLVLRPGLFAWSSGRELAQRLLEPPPAAEGPLADGRRAARARQEFLWARIAGEALRADPESAEALGHAGLGALRHVMLGLGLEAGQLATRVRLQGVSDHGLAALLTPSKARWSGLDLITADTLAVAGLPRDLPEIAALLPEVAAALNPAAGEEMQSLLALVLRDPLLQPLLDPAHLHGETILFVRPGAAMTPMPYLALAGAPPVEQALARAEVEAARVEAELARARAGGTPLPPGRIVRVRAISGERCLVISATARRNAPTIAFLRSGPGLLVGNSAFSIESWMRQRGRERLAAREELVESLRAAPASGAPGELVAFVHVRTRSLVEWIWPVALMAVNLTGAADVEGFPDAEEVAEILGDSSWRLYRDADALELRASGLLGGLLLVF